MTEEQNALARRAVACKGWRWMPGMRTLDEERMSDEGWPMYEILDHGATATVETVEWHDAASRNALPDLTDPATLGCLLALVREAWGEFGMETFVRHLVGGVARSPCWVAQTRDRFGWNAYEGSSEAEALVAALEAAP